MDRESSGLWTWNGDWLLRSSGELGAEVSCGETIPRRENLSEHPLSFTQQRLWFLDQLAPRGPATNVSQALRIEGSLNTEALAKALECIVARHELLRARFGSVGGAPFQVIAEDSSAEIQTFDLRMSADAGRASEVQRVITTESPKRFDLSRGSLFRFLLLRLREQEHVFVATMHPIVADTCSIGVFFRELAILYLALSTGQPAHLGQLQIQYADFAHWQRRQLEAGAYDCHMQYWRKQLDGAPGVLELPAGRPRAVDSTCLPETHSIKLSRDLRAALEELSCSNGIAPPISLLAVFQVLLQRLSAQDDILVGSWVSGRDLTATEDLIGPLSNEVVLRTDLSGYPTFCELLSRVKSQMLEAHAHRDLPFKTLVDGLKSSRSLSYAPVFQVAFHTLTFHARKVEMPGLRVEVIANTEPNSNLDLTLNVRDTGEALLLDLAYDARLFERPQIVELMNQYEYLLEQVVEDPGKCIQSYSLSTSQSRRLLPDPSVELTEPEYEPVSKMFALQVTRGPQQAAVCQREGIWTYEDLSVRSGRLARTLILFGIERGEVVAVSGMRSFGLVSSMMAVVSSGGVLLLVDPNLPQSRQMVLLRESKAKRMLHVGRRTPADEWIRDFSPSFMLEVNPDDGILSSPAQPGSLDAVRLPEIMPNDPAYIFFTSGTTGVPKGVKGCHKGLSHFLTWQKSTFQVGPGDRCSQLASLSFDMVLRDVFLPLVSGATLCLPEKEAEIPSDEVLPWLNRERITLLHTVPSVAQSWLHSLPQPFEVPTLRCVFFAGEPLTDSLVRRWKEMLPDSGRIVNLYGPTETTLAKCFHEVAGEPVPGVQPIGKPLPETQALVMAEDGRPCGIGEPGEIVLRTPFRSLGYVNAAEEQCKRFVKNPFREDSGDLIYHTGDRGFFRPDGLLAIFGRIDDQVKIWGVRVEPDEITAVLSQNPKVKACTVVGFPGRNRLVAYVVSSAPEPKLASELRSYLNHRLPPVMVPADFIFLEKLPITANGKVDRSALPAPQLQKPKEEDPHAPPRTPVEEVLCNIWAEVLGLERVGIHDDFFDLGGHSLLATQVISGLRRSFDVSLPLRCLFETPTIAGLSQRIDTALRAALPEAPMISPSSRKGPLPLSFAQQRLWFLAQLEPENVAYNLSKLLVVKGAMDYDLLQRALNAIVARHETLRTTFAQVDGNPVQLIAPRLDIGIPAEDLRSYPEEKRKDEAERRVREDARRPFDLNRGPLLRARVLRLTEEDHFLLLTTHHIVSDEWSIGILLRELAALYQSLYKGAGASLPELPIQYADYALWQRDWLQGETMETQLLYWKERLGGTLPVLELPTDRPRPATPTWRGANKSFLVPRTIQDALNALGREEKSTLFMVLLAAFNVLLYRYTGQEDIIVGSPIAGRNRAEIEDLVGFFVNTLALRTDLSGGPTFRELLARVRNVCLGAYAHQDFPFHMLVQELNPKRDRSHSPLLQVMLASQNVPRAELCVPGLDAISVAVDSGTSKFELTLFVTERPEALKGTMEYATDLFDTSTIERMIGNYQTLLEGIVADPDQRIGLLPLLTRAERQQILIEWNKTDADCPNDACLHRLFEKQAELSPNAIAVTFEGQSLTYRLLDRRANQLAHYLQKHGVGTDVHVGICMEQSLDMVIGILGILKAGGVYVPLDPDYPTERLRFMLEDAAVPVLLVQESLLSRISGSRSNIICIDTHHPAIEVQDCEALSSTVKTGDLAYVIYTSGSTGRPKGVMISHRAICNRLLWMQDAYRLTVADRVLQKTPFSFDVSLWEFFWPLLTGARLVLARPGGHRDCTYLAGLIPRQRISVLHFVPSMLELFLEEPGLQACSCLRHVICSGEALSFGLQERFFARLDAALHNLYGPTEAAVDVTAWTCERKSERQMVPIGRPISNTQIYVLDAHLQPVPIGVVGDLYAGGAGLARGYLRRSELTADKFIANPFNDKAGDRLYATGDLARYLPDGNIEFVGRADDQFKIRGVRIEPGEIESVLRTHPEIKRAAVAVREDSEGKRQLVAYVIPAGNPAPSFKELHNHLKRSLPDSMIPSAFVMLDKLPLTPSGKVYRRALPPPDSIGQGLEETYVAPRTPIEELVAGVWAETLEVDRVGIHDDFLELGGHSLLATRIIAELSAKLGVELSLRTFFEAPTVAALSALIPDNACERENISLSVPRVSRAGNIWASFGQEQFWFFAQRCPDTAVYNESFTVYLKGPIDIDALQHGLDEIIRRHEVLRTTFAAVDGRPVQVIASHAPIKMTLLDLKHYPDSEREAEAFRKATILAQQPFDLTQLPLMWAMLACLDETDFRLFLTLHHITIDAFGFYRVFVKELWQLYEAYRAGAPSPLEEPTVQYADYACRRRLQMEGSEMELHRSFWKNHLAGAPLLELPTDRPRPPVPTFRGARQCLHFPRGLALALQRLSRQEGVTLYMTLLAAFNVLLSRYSGQEDIVLGTVAGGRDLKETESLLGCVFETLALRTDLSGNPSFRELLGRLRHACLQAYAHLDVPLSKVVEEVQPDRDPRRHPLFEVMFVLEPSIPAYESGWTVSQLDIHSGTAKFDLTMELEERNESIIGRIEYRTDLFDAATIERMIAHFQTLLEGIVSDPNRQIGRLPLLTQAERKQILVGWNKTEADYPKDVCVHQLFEKQVERSPDAIAVTYQGESLTYGELNRRANRLAHYLRKHRVGPDVIVAICMERSLEMVVSILGILKAGGTYLPLDPDYPKERLEFMIEDAHAPVLITQSGLAPSLPVSSAHLLCLDADHAAMSSERQANPSQDAGPENLAYVIYTSGSTGRPKGVMISHRSLCNHMAWLQRAHPLSVSDAVLQKTPFSFDASVWEFYAPLLAGARLIVAPPGAHADADVLVRVLIENKVSVLQLVPSLLAHLLEKGTFRMCRSLKHVFCGGEVLSADLADRVFEQLPSVALHNLYGPTEATIDALCWSCLAHGKLSTVPIGRPIDNVQAYVVDTHLQPVPAGVSGELLLGGDGLARGYLGLPELTAEKFIADPFSGKVGARLYRTGDLVRWLADGNLEFLGRTDDQVKIRGYRIEPGEIESVLARHPQVKQAAIVARKDTRGGKRLVAYTVPAGEQPPSFKDLRGYLKQSLPDYMVPSTFVSLDKLPLTPSGKVDRRALPAPGMDRLEAPLTYEAPRLPVEELVAKIWSEVLGKERVGIRDNFFDLGGHSLLATRMMARVQHTFEVDLPLRALFDAPTVEGMALAVVQCMSMKEETEFDDLLGETWEES